MRSVCTVASLPRTSSTMYDELCGMIRKRDKRIGGFGHEQVLQNNGATDGRGESIGA
jgi:hypothetical protein